MGAWKNFLSEVADEVHSTMSLLDPDFDWDLAFEATMDSLEAIDGSTAASVEDLSRDALVRVAADAVLARLT